MWRVLSLGLLVLGGVLRASADVTPPAEPGARALPRPGTYRLSGSVLSDTCGGLVGLAAQHLTVAADGHSIHADVVERTYAARRQGDTLVATGGFAEGACPGADLVERWELRATGPGTLRGTLASRWRLPGDCAASCTIVFAISGER
jgi:hypothetical protein